MKQGCDNEPQNNFWFFVETKMMSSYLDLDLEQSYYLEAYDNGPNGFPSVSLQSDCTNLGILTS